MAGRVALTSAGSRVAYIGKDLAQALPGRPLDQCRIVAHLTVFAAPAADWICLRSNSISAILRNEAARHGGNCVLFVNAEHTYTAPLMCISEINGIALSCPESVLQSAGFDNISWREIESSEISSDGSAPSHKTSRSRKHD